MSGIRQADPVLTSGMYLSILLIAPPVGLLAGALGLAARRATSLCRGPRADRTS